MHLEQGIAVALRLLQQQAKAKNSELLELLGGDQELLEKVRESLIFDDLAQDKNGVGLVYAGPAASPATNESPPEQPRPQPAARPTPPPLARPHLIPRPPARPGPLLAPPSAAAKPPAGPPTLRLGTFYIWKAGTETGPFDFSELQSRAADGQLTHQEFVKTGLDGDWIPSNKISGLFPDADKAAVDLLLAPDHSIPVVETAIANPAASAPIEAPVVPPDTAPRTAPISANTSQAAPATDPSTRSPRVSYWTPEPETVNRTLYQRVRQQPIRWLSGPILLLIAFGGFWYWPLSEKYVYTEFQAVWTEMKGLRDHQASPKEWRDFTEKSKARVLPLCERLERSVNSKRPARQELLWAGRHCLLKLLEGSATEPGMVAKLYERHMDRAQKMMAGEKLDEAIPASTEDPADPTSPAKAVTPEISLIPPGAPGYKPPVKPAK
ncbi:MAG: hypothetical protein JWN70_3524 [Planctomycetaceae bacterium]|nr:hypothetical protein [Planctomycetaceae bacterium]